LTPERHATIANGLLVIVGVVLAAIPSTRWAGLWMTGFMGVSLIFSGVTGFCGWVRILPRK